MTDFEDGLWSELVSDHGAELLQMGPRPRTRPRRSWRASLAAGGIALTGAIVAAALTVTASTSPPAYALGRAMRGRAVRLQEDIEETGISGVQAVVVFWNPFPAGVGYGHRVVYLHGERLAGWLQVQEPKIAPDMVSRVAAAIEQARPPENRTWWERLAMVRFRRRRAVSESGSTAAAA